MFTLRTFPVVAFSLAASFAVAGCGGGGGEASTTPRAPTTPARREAKATPASEFEVLARAASKTLPSGAKLDVPAGWWLRELAAGLAFEDPERELTITILEVDAETIDAAGQLALAKLGHPVPEKIARTARESDQQGWDDITDTVWETPPSEQRVFAMNVRRKGKKAWAAILEGKLAAFSRRGAQVQQAVMGLEVNGVTDEDLSAKVAFPVEGPRLEALVKFLDEAREKTRVPGAAVAVVQNGKVVLAKGFGVRERGKKEPVTERTRFMIGSVTKSLSTLLVASLVDSGKLRWNTRIKELFPAFETGDAKLTDALTVENTFCACTGMPRRDLDLLFEYGSHKPEDALTAFKGIKPTTAMGETFQYSNQMTALGGFLAARVAEPAKPLAGAYVSAMKARVFGPMGMKDTTASFDEGKNGAVASPHGGSLVSAPDEPVVLPLAIERFVESAAPAGSVFSTAEDMARYALVELAKGKTPDGKQAFTEENLLERRKLRVRLGAKGGYGLGLATSDLHGLNVVTHDGGTFGFVTRFALFPEKNLGLVVLTNSASSGAAFLDAATQRLVEIAFDAKEHASRDLDKALEESREQWKKQHDEVAARPVPNEIVQRVAGTWKNERIGSFVFATGKDGLRVDVGEWSSRVGYRKAEDGSGRLFFLDPPVGGLPMTITDTAIVLELGQESYRLVRK